MNISRTIFLIVIALAAGSYVFAQNDYSNNRSDHSDRNNRPERFGGRHNHGGNGGSGGSSTNGVPAPDAYQDFSTFIAKRNIFDPNRIPSFTGTTTYHPPTINRGAPFFMLVGTMSYAKGSFAFFDGNSSDSRQALQVSGKIQDYTVTAIDTRGVTIESPDKTVQKLLMGDRMQEENGKWSFLAGNAMNDSGSPAEDSGSSSGQGASPDSSSPSSQTPPSASESNDILKRLMQLREKDNQ